MFECRLCLALGYTLAKLRREVTSDELVIWQAYEAQHGYPTDRAEVQRAMVGAAFVGVMGGKIKAAELIPDRHEPQQVTATEGIAIIKAAAVKLKKSKPKRIDARRSSS